MEIGNRIKILDKKKFGDVDRSSNNLTTKVINIKKFND